MAQDAAAKDKADAAALEELVAKDDDLEFVSEGGRTKVHFKCTGHDEPARLKLVQEYMKGGKYRKAREWYSADFKQFEPDIVQHKDNPKFLRCLLTGTTIPKTLAKVQVHIASTRFKELKKEKDEKDAKQSEKLEKKRSENKADGAAEKAGGDGDAKGKDKKKQKKAG